MFHATINDEPVYMGGCAIKYDHVNNLIFLANDAGTGWLGPVPVEESYRLYNSRCLIDSVQTRLAGQEFMLYVDVFFMGDQAGEKNVYTYAQDFGGLNSGWIEQATFTIVPDNRPLPLAVNPSFGTGYEKTFRLDFVDEDGYTDIEGVIIKIGDGCILLYHTDTDFISNYSQSGTLGSSGIIENSYCAINTDVSTASGNGTVLTLYFAMIFKPGWEGDKNISLTVWDGEGVNEGIRGNWTVGPYISDDFNGDDIFTYHANRQLIDISL